MKKIYRYLTSIILLTGFLAGCDNKPSPTPSKDIKVTGVTLNESSKSLYIDETFSLSATIAPSDATNQDITWTVDNEHVSISSTSSKDITVTAVSEGTSIVTVTTVDGGYTSSCTFNVSEIPATTVKAYINDEYSLFKSIEQLDKGSYVACTDSGYEEGVLFYNVKENISTRIKLEANEYIVPTGIVMNEVTYAIDDDGYVTFNSDKTFYDALYVTVKYKNTAPSDVGYLLNVTNTDHITLKLYDSDDLTHEIDHCELNKYVYIKAEISSTDFFVKRMYTERAPDYIGSPVIEDATYIADKDLYSFQVKTAYNEIIKIHVTEGDNTLLKDTDLVGEYLSVWFTTATKVINDFQKNGATHNNLIVEQSGHLTYCPQFTSPRVDNVTSYTSDTLELKSHHTIIYGKDYILANVNCDNGFMEPFGSNYDVFFIKKQSDSDANGIYSIAGERIKLNGTDYIIIRIYRSGAEYHNFVFDYTNKKIYQDLEFKIIYGEEITDQQVIYEIKDNGVTFLGISYIYDGGINNRIPLVSPYGVYQGDKGEFVLANSIVGIYDGVKFVAVLDGNTVTLTVSDRKVVLTLDTDKFTYTVVSDEEVTSSIPDLHNKVFSGNFYSKFDEEYFDATFAFNDYTGDDDIRVKITINLGYTKYYAWFDVTYDLDTNIISCKIDLASQAYKWITEEKTITALMSTGKLVPQDDLNNVVTFKNTEFTCPDFVIN